MKLEHIQHIAGLPIRHVVFRDGLTISPRQARKFIRLLKAQRTKQIQVQDVIDTPDGFAIVWVDCKITCNDWHLVLRVKP